MVVPVLVASPSDTNKLREVVRETLEDWNGVHARREGVALLPVMWERDSTPEMGARPQAILNEQLDADMLVAVFWTRLGTPTGEADSGSVEEIERFIEAGKPVMLYFSEEPHPHDADLEQLAKVRAYRDNVESRGVVHSFASIEEFRTMLNAGLTRTISRRFAPHLSMETSVLGDAAPAQQAVILGRIWRLGRSPRARLLVENNGDAAAEDLTFEVVGSEGARGPTIAGPDKPITVLPPGGQLEYPMVIAKDTWDIIFRWKEGDVEHEARQTMQ